MKKLMLATLAILIVMAVAAMAPAPVPVPAVAPPPALLPPPKVEVRVTPLAFQSIGIMPIGQTNFFNQSPFLALYAATTNRPFRAFEQALFGDKSLKCDKEILNILGRLGSDRYVVRVAAFKELEKIDEEKCPMRYFGAILSGDITDKDGKPLYDIEQCRSVKRIYKRHLKIVSDIEDVPVPGIWHIANTIRFPFGFSRPGDNNWDIVRYWAQGKKIEYDSDKGIYNAYDTRYWTPYDISEFYFLKAKAKHNNCMEQLSEKGNILGSNIWRNQEVEEEATRLLIEDLRKGGMSRREVERLLNRMVIWRRDLSYPYQSGYNDSSDEIKPTPAN